MKRIIIPMICILSIALAFSEQLLSIAQAAGPPVKGAIGINCAQNHTVKVTDTPPGWIWSGPSQRLFFTRALVVNRTLTCQYGDQPSSPKLMKMHKPGLVCEAGHPGANFWCWDKNIPSPKKSIKPRRR